MQVVSRVEACFEEITFWIINISTNIAIDIKIIIDTLFNHEKNSTSVQNSIIYRYFMDCFSYMARAYIFQIITSGQSLANSKFNHEFATFITF